MELKLEEGQLRHLHTHELQTAVTPPARRTSPNDDRSTTTLRRKRNQNNQEMSRVIAPPTTPLISEYYPFRKQVFRGDDRCLNVLDLIHSLEAGPSGTPTPLNAKHSSPKDTPYTNT